MTGDQRLEALPDIPTFAEAGLPGLAMRNWNAISAPAGTPKQVIQILEAAVRKASGLPEVKAAITKRGLFPYFASSEDLDAMRRQDIVVVGKLIKAAHIKMMD